MNYKKYFKIHNSIRYLLIIIMASIPIYICQTNHLTKNNLLNKISKFEITNTVKTKKPNVSNKHSEIYDPSGKN